MPRKRLTRPQRWAATLGILVLLLGLGRLGRAGVTLRTATLLPDLPLTIPLEYVVVVSTFWGVSLVICGLGLIRFRPWSRWAAPISVTLYQANSWLDRLLFDASDYAFQTRPRDLVLTALLLAFVWGLLHLPSVRGVFRP
jgi:sulfite exporter TauE/SafE